MFTAIRMAAGRIGAAVAVSSLLAGPAWAACLESEVGCTDSEVIPYPALRQLSCDALWAVRETIYVENSCCFEITGAQLVYDSSGNLNGVDASVPLNFYERRNSDRALRVERQKGC